MKFVIEHLDPELFDWSIIEYSHISEIVGRDDLIFTNVPKDSAVSQLVNLGRVINSSVCDTECKLKLSNVCVLDPTANKLLSSKDIFEYYIFGGVLGDDPPQNRTYAEITSKLKSVSRNLGAKQLSTDTAVLVAKKILSGEDFSKMKFQDGVEIVLDEGESVELPFTYLIEKEKIVLPNGLVEHLTNFPGFT